MIVSIGTYLAGIWNKYYYCVYDSTSTYQKRLCEQATWVHPGRFSCRKMCVLEEKHSLFSFAVYYFFGIGWLLLLLILLIHFHNNIRDRHILLRPALVQPLIRHGQNPTSPLTLSPFYTWWVWPHLNLRRFLTTYLTLRTLSVVADTDLLGCWAQMGVLVCFYFIWEALWTASICVCFLELLHQFAAV
jgi:hypothetical protein